MTKELLAVVEGRSYPVIVSDEEPALLAAKAAGRAVLGLWDLSRPERAPFGVPYLIDREEEITEEYLEQIVRRQMGLPWKIAGTKRLLLREFTREDWEPFRKMQQETRQKMFPDSMWQAADGMFDHQGFLSYIKCQYPFYEYGIWAVIETESGMLIGAAGIWDMEEEPEAPIKELAAPPVEIGYWIRPSFQRRGYGREAVQAVLQYAGQKLGRPIYAKIRKGNLPSRNLAQQLGFILHSEESESIQVWYHCGTSSSPRPDNME